MITRLSTAAVVVFWLASMAWLVWHDVWPAWTAQDAPRFVAGDWLADGVRRAQARIENKYGHRIGTAWTEHRSAASGLTRRDDIWLDKLPMLPPLRIEAESDFTPDGRLDTFVLKVFGHDERIALRGELYSGQIAFLLEVGTTRQLFKVDAAVGGMVADAFRPFPALPEIHVGQSWRMQVVNPLSAVTGVGSKMIPLLVRVTGQEMLATDRGLVKCYVIEAGQAKAWVDSEGSVLRQEINLPYGGTFAIIDEPFDDAARYDARAARLPPYH
jgi:hypothetical protein